MTEIQFPAWGFFSLYSLDMTLSFKRHLFLNEKIVACGWKPKSGLTPCFSERAFVDGIYELLFEMKKDRLLEPDDFPKCKRCLKIKAEATEK